MIGISLNQQETRYALEFPENSRHLTFDWSVLSIIHDRTHEQTLGTVTDVTSLISARMVWAIDTTNVTSGGP
ncbi:MAG: hypothetical protein KME45_00335 [Stenomitos rutilans HA7619-LM2]|nr:hypothetical protein [Stenomitos rutilans HA7619-LM2]